MLGIGLEKAYIEIMNGLRTGIKLPVLFNPSEYSIERGNTYKSTPVPQLGSPLIQFINGDATTLAMELFIDDRTDPLGSTDVAGGISGSFSGLPMSADDRINSIISLLDIDATLHAPPRVCFAWGKLRFEAVIEKIGRKITLFHPNGTPARATLSVAFRQYCPLAKQLDNPRRLSSDKTKRRQIRNTENIWDIAAKEYGDSRAWRNIANASDVDDPRSLQSGFWVKVPPLESFDGLAR
jgi:Contractile injection system tube protein